MAGNSFDHGPAYEAAAAGIGLSTIAYRRLDQVAVLSNMKSASKQGRPAAMDKVMGTRRRSATNRADGEITRRRILDAAERLFSIDGFTGVSVRAITAAAEVDLALVNYYFGSKEKLFHEVLIRRVDAMSQKRLDSLALIKIKKNDSATLDNILEAFLSPIIGETPEEKATLRNYRLLIALVTNSKTWQDIVFKEHYDPVAREYINALCRALPRAPRASVVWAFTFFLGSLVNAVAETGRIDRLSDGMCKSNDLDEASRQLKSFTVAAMLGIRATERKRVGARKSQ